MWTCVVVCLSTCELVYLCTCEPVYFCAFIRNLQINTEDSGDGDNQGVDGLDDKPKEPDQEEDKKKKKTKSKRSTSLQQKVEKKEEAIFEVQIAGPGQVKDCGATGFT